MSKTDDYKKAKSVASIVKTNMMDALGKSDPTIREHSLEARYANTLTDGWSVATLWLHASHEHRNSSRLHSNMPKEVAKYLVKAINENMAGLAVRAIALAEADMEKARKEAEAEAKEVLRITKEVLRITKEGVAM